jgi:hypothetical protein
VGGQAAIRPIRLKVWDEELRTDKIILVGYRGYCPCGHQTGREPTHNAARRALLDHKAQEHGHRPAAAKAKR